MGLKDRLATPPLHKSNNRCKLFVVLSQLPKEDAKEVIKVLDSLSKNEGLYTASWLAKQITQEGFYMNHSTVLRHARKECCCAR